MVLKFFCSSCGKKLSVPDARAGVTGKCPRCGAGIQAPEKPATPSDDDLSSATVQQLCEGCGPAGPTPEFSTHDRDRITRELRGAVAIVGALLVEEAMWILIPVNTSDESIRINAVGGTNKVLAKVRFPNTAYFDPSEEEKSQLVKRMKSARWVLHVHNHPSIAGYVTLIDPSEADFGFATYWKSLDSDLSARMKFFVVKGNEVVEYSIGNWRFRSWLLDQLPKS